MRYNLLLLLLISPAILADNSVVEKVAGEHFNIQYSFEKVVCSKTPTNGYHQCDHVVTGVTIDTTYCNEKYCKEGAVVI